MAKGREQVKNFSAFVKALDDIGAIKVQVEPWERYPTEIATLDLAFGGGIPKNSMTQIYGDEGTGKSTIAYLIIANAIRRGEKCLLVDMENSLDEEYATKLGLDVHATDGKGKPLLTVLRASHGEQAWEIVRMGLESKEFSLIVIDTLAMFAAKAMVGSDMEAAFIGVDARMNAHAMKVIAEPMYSSGTAVLVLNQVRVDIGAYGAPPTAPGGKAVKHMNRLVLKTGSKELIVKPNGEVTGLKFKFTVKKSKISLENPKTEHFIYIAVVGNKMVLDTAYELYNAAVRLRLFKNAEGEPWVNRVAYFNGQKVANGEDNIIAFLGVVSPLQQEIAQAVVEGMQNGGLEISSETVPADEAGGAESGDFEPAEFDD